MITLLIIIITSFVSVAAWSNYRLMNSPATQSLEYGLSS